MGQPYSLRLASWVMLSQLTLMVVIIRAGADSKNGSSGGLFWSAAKEEQDLLQEAEPKDDSTSSTLVNDVDEVDGGFSSLDGMLQWAIGHSDPAKLKETAQDVQHLSPNELKRRQEEIKELMEKLKMPSDAQLMQTALNDLNNSSLSLEDQHRALEELLILVEPIDNSNDLSKMGGLIVVVKQLDHPDSDVRRISAWILGKASQNNPFIQKEVLQLGALTKLMKMVKANLVEEAIKALYAVSALIRNNFAAQEIFYAAAGELLLQDLLSNSSIDVRLRRKAVFLVGDLALSLSENKKKAEPPIFSNHFLLKSVVDLTMSVDLDLQEKALVAIKNLLQLKVVEDLVLKDSCGLQSALEKMKQQLHHLMMEEDHRDYAIDVENLRKEVESLFHEKRGVVTGVPCHT
ncbi:hsp70 nucleotide exchange factor FES1 [Carica papaya]|uniref:hsp70 nucleotide exchange factor FES1 n=1 Tax=Carica papaya TaxID=3649 RepID=UPI000B8D053F|nr:hsp70 nucleotide exchange factor FES1 [Carica papaya]